MEPRNFEDLVLGYTVGWIAEHHPEVDRRDIRAWVFEHVGEAEVHELIRVRFSEALEERGPGEIGRDPATLSRRS